MPLVIRFFCFAFAYLGDIDITYAAGPLDNTPDLKDIDAVGGRSPKANIDAGTGVSPKANIDAETVSNKADIDSEVRGTKRKADTDSQVGSRKRKVDTDSQIGSRKRKADTDIGEGSSKRRADMDSGVDSSKGKGKAIMDSGVDSSKGKGKAIIDPGVGSSKGGGFNYLKGSSGDKSKPDPNPIFDAKGKAIINPLRKWDEDGGWVRVKEPGSRIITHYRDGEVELRKPIDPWYLGRDPSTTKMIHLIDRMPKPSNNEPAVGPGSFQTRTMRGPLPGGHVLAGGKSQNQLSPYETNPFAQYEGARPGFFGPKIGPYDFGETRGQRTERIIKQAAEPGDMLSPGLAHYAEKFSDTGIGRSTKVSIDPWSDGNKKTEVVPQSAYKLGLNGELIRVHGVDGITEFQGYTDAPGGKLANTLSEAKRIKYKAELVLNNQVPVECEVGGRGLCGFRTGYPTGVVQPMPIPTMDGTTTVTAITAESVTREAANAQPVEYINDYHKLTDLQKKTLENDYYNKVRSIFSSATQEQITTQMHIYCAKKEAGILTEKEENEEAILKALDQLAKHKKNMANASFEEEFGRQRFYVEEGVGLERFGYAGSGFTSNENHTNAEKKIAKLITKAVELEGDCVKKLNDNKAKMALNFLTLDFLAWKK